MHSILQENVFCCSFNATLMLEMLRGKRMLFVGDSLNRGQYVSLVCLLHRIIPESSKSMETFDSLTVFRAKVFPLYLSMWRMKWLETEWSIGTLLRMRCINFLFFAFHQTTFITKDILAFLHSFPLFSMYSNFCSWYASMHVSSSVFPCKFCLWKGPLEARAVKKDEQTPIYKCFIYVLVTEKKGY